MSIVDKELDRCIGATDEAQMRALIKLARELEAHCEAMAKELDYWLDYEDYDKSQVLISYQKFCQERTR